jgi:hypothetical protein
MTKKLCEEMGPKYTHNTRHTHTHTHHNLHVRTRMYIYIDVLSSVADCLRVHDPIVWSSVMLFIFLVQPCLHCAEANNCCAYVTTTTTTSFFRFFQVCFIIRTSSAILWPDNQFTHYGIFFFSSFSFPSYVRRARWLLLLLVVRTNDCYGWWLFERTINAIDVFAGISSRRQFLSNFVTERRIYFYQFIFCPLFHSTGTVKHLLSHPSSSLICVMWNVT